MTIFLLTLLSALAIPNTIFGLSFNPSLIVENILEGEKIVFKDNLIEEYQKSINILKFEDKKRLSYFKKSKNKKSYSEISNFYSPNCKSFSYYEIINFGDEYCHNKITKNKLKSIFITFIKNNSPIENKTLSKADFDELHLAEMKYKPIVLYLKQLFTHSISYLFLGIFIGVVLYRSRYRLPFFLLIKKINIERKRRKNPEFYKRIDSLPTYAEAQLTYSKYKKGVPLFLDRSYSDSMGDHRLDNLYLIQINRHEIKNIIIKTDSPIIIYRFVPRENSGLNHSYEKTNIKVKVEGKSNIDLIYVLKKNFESGNIVLSPGGPSCAAPILFSSYGKKIPNILIEKS